jgi:hypothetical protein
MYYLKIYAIELTAINRYLKSMRMKNLLVLLASAVALSGCCSMAYGPSHCANENAPTQEQLQSSGLAVPPQVQTDAAPAPQILAPNAAPLYHMEPVMAAPAPQPAPAPAPLVVQAPFTASPSVHALDNVPAPSKKAVAPVIKAAPKAEDSWPHL